MKNLKKKFGISEPLQHINEVNTQECLPGLQDLTSKSAIGCKSYVNYYHIEQSETRLKVGEKWGLQFQKI